MIQEGRVLHPVEVKKKALPDLDDVANFGVLAQIDGYEVGQGAVICQAERVMPLSKDVDVVPVWSL